MRTTLKSLALVATALALAWSGWTTPALAQSLARVDKLSNADFARTVRQAETALKSKGMMIVAEINHQSMMGMVGASMKGSKTIEFGKPDLGKMTVVPNPEVGLEFPGKIYIWERGDGRTVVSYYRPGPAFAAYGKENLKAAGEMMDKMLEEIVAEATK